MWTRLWRAAHWFDAPCENNCRNREGFDLHHSLRKTSYDRDFSLDKSKVCRYIYNEAVPTGFISTGLLS